MTAAPLRVTARAARRLVVTQQHLAGARPARVSAERIVRTVHDLPYVQWDPVTVVAPSHLLSLWARLGPFRPADFDRLLWKERRLLQHWIPFASVVPTEDYPLHASFMRRYPDSLSDSWGSQREAARAFLARHGDLRKGVLRDLRHGPLLLGQFTDHARTKRDSGDWAPASAVAEMLWHLLMSGEVMVVGHEGSQNLWGRTEAFLPPAVRRKVLGPEAGLRAAAEKALRGLGVASAKEVQHYFIRGCYPNVRGTLADLLAEGRAQPVVVEGLAGHEERYVLAEAVDRLHALENGAFSPRVSLLPPFDNMVASQARGRRLFDFDYVREQFLPKERRRFGMWVLPILRGERFIGRMDARLNKERRVLEVVAVFAETEAPMERTIAAEIDEELQRLAGFLGADSVAYSRRVPAGWRGVLH